MYCPRISPSCVLGLFTERAAILGGKARERLTHLPSCPVSDGGKAQKTDSLQPRESYTSRRTTDEDGLRRARLRRKGGTSIRDPGGGRLHTCKHFSSHATAHAVVNGQVIPHRPPGPDVQLATESPGLPRFRASVRISRGGHEAQTKRLDTAGRSRKSTGLIRARPRHGQSGSCACYETRPGTREVEPAVRRECGEHRP